MRRTILAAVLLLSFSACKKSMDADLIVKQENLPTGISRADCIYLYEPSSADASYCGAVGWACLKVRYQLRVRGIWQRETTVYMNESQLQGLAEQWATPVSVMVGKIVCRPGQGSF